jgi:hypothetical protein
MKMFRELEKDEAPEPNDICLHPLHNFKIREIPEPIVALIRECCKVASEETNAHVNRAREIIGKAIIDSGK